jgi:3-deoxy-7-phosphoheptulonate synthase
VEVALSIISEINLKQIDNVRVKNMVPLITPKELQLEHQNTDKANETVLTARETIHDILEKKDKRILLITGPCSIHDKKAAIDYASRLSKLKEKVEDAFFIVMRTYMEKPRTSIGWKGLINDPFLDDSHNIIEGLRMARHILLKINEMGVPAATEYVDPITPQYISTLTSWAAIGARTIESQTHREMASGLSMPVGLKNSTDGNLTVALNALKAAISPQSFLGIDENGRTSVVNTLGNPWVHLVLRGGLRPNYDKESIKYAQSQLREMDQLENIMIDCSHNNSMKKHSWQPHVWRNVIEQRVDGNDSIIGLMLESNIHEGNQKLTGHLEDLEYGVSITDECISWETTEELILESHDILTDIRGV